MDPTPDIHIPVNGDRAGPERNSRILPNDELVVVQFDNCRSLATLRLRGQLVLLAGAGSSTEYVNGGEGVSVVGWVVDEQ